MHNTQVFQFFFLEYEIFTKWSLVKILALFVEQGEGATAASDPSEKFEGIFLFFLCFFIFCKHGQFCVLIILAKLAIKELPSKCDHLIWFVVKDV